MLDEKCRDCAFSCDNKECLDISGEMDCWANPKLDDVGVEEFEEILEPTIRNPKKKVKFDIDKVVF